MPNARVRVQTEYGGYLVRANAAGFRSEREFVKERAPGVFRALLFGDSQTAGTGVANAERYSDLLEAVLPALEVNNYAVFGTATDQQYLTYQEHASTEHDLIVIGLYVENIRRITSRVIRTRDASGTVSFRAKPYFELASGKLTLHNVPVPKTLWTADTLPEELLPYAYSFGETNFFFRSDSPGQERVRRAFARLGPVRGVGKRLLTRFRKFQPLPDYDTPRTPGWLLLREILKEWISASGVPVLLLPLPHDSYISGLSDPSQYQARFRELAAETGCHLYDPLPRLLERTASTRRSLLSQASGHLSAQGHAAIAQLLTPVIQQLMEARAGTSALTPVPISAETSEGLRGRSALAERSC